MEKFLKFLLTAVVLALALLYVAVFGGPAILKLYVERGVGSCSTTPILCMSPDSEFVNPQVNREYLKELLPYKFPDISLSVPKGFDVVKERITKVYYKRQKHRKSDSTFYLLYEPPGFFVGLFPRLKKQGVTDDYEFFRRIMSARLTGINNLTDAFFAITKGIFIPNLGNQKGIRMLKFSASGMKGFLNCNLSAEGNFYDCNLFGDKGHFFKIYIRDKSRKIDLEKLATIISTVKKEY